MLLYFALIQGRGAAGGEEGMGGEEGRVTGKAEQRWMKGGNGVMPYLLVTV